MLSSSESPISHPGSFITARIRLACATEEGCRYSWAEHDSVIVVWFSI